MRVMPDDDVFFIMDVKPEDMGMYSCTAKNTAGMISANVTLTVLGKAKLLGCISFFNTFKVMIIFHFINFASPA